MSLTQRAQASAAAATSTDVAPTPPTRQSCRRPSRKVLIAAAAVTVGVVVGATGGYAAYRTSLAERQVVERGRAADTAPSAE